MSELPEIINNSSEDKQKRPRGRPRKYPISTEPKIPKKRGRKPKPVDPNKVKRPIGRPRKPESEKVKQVWIPTGNPRGRPRIHPKKEPSINPKKEPSLVKRSRGRPRIHPVKVVKYHKKKLNGDWSNPDYKRQYQRVLMRHRLRKIRGVKRHINILDDGRLWSQVKDQINAK